MDLGLSEVWESFVILLPTISSAIIVLIIGWAVGRIVGRFISTILKRSSIDRLLEKTIIGKAVISSGIEPIRFFDLLVRWIIYIIALFVALDILQIKILGDFMKAVMAYLPNFITGVVILIFGFIIADFVGNFATTLGRKSKLFFPAIIGSIIKLILYFMVVTMALAQMKIEVQILYIFANALAWGSAIGIGVGLGIAFGWGLKDIIAKRAIKWIRTTEKAAKCCEDELKKQENKN